MDFICPRCHHPGTKADCHTYCMRCYNERQRDKRRRAAIRGGATKRVVTKDRSESLAMKGFNELSQNYLSKKL